MARERSPFPKTEQTHLPVSVSLKRNCAQMCQMGGGNPSPLITIPILLSPTSTLRAELFVTAPLRCLVVTLFQLVITLQSPPTKTMQLRR